MKATSIQKKSSAKGNVKEELDSSNKELETSKEGKESAKQELTTNQELQTRNDLLNESYDYIEAVLATIHEPMLVLDKNLRVKSANKTFCKTFNVKEEDTEGILLYDLGNRQWNIPSLRELLEDLLPKNTHFHGFEITHIFPLIGEKTMLLNARRIIQKANHEELILLAISDITEEASARRKIEESEKRYNMMLMESPFAFAVLKGKNKVITFANDKMKATWGKGNNVEGKPLIEVLPELKDTPFPNLLDEVYKTGIPYHANDVLAPKYINGQKEDVYYNFVYQPYREADETISGVTIIAAEVTAAVKVKKALEAQHEVEQKALRLVEDSEKRYNMMLMNSPFSFAVLKGKDLIIDLANDQIKEVWGRGNDIEGKSLLEIMPELKNTTFLDMLDEVRATGIPFHGIEVQSPKNMHGHIKEEYFFNFVFQPYLETDQTISGITIIGNEVTEQVIARNKNLETQAMHAKELEEKVQQRTKELNEANNLLQGKNEELAIQNEEKEKRAAELIIANKELAFQNDEKENRAAELVIANTKLVFESGEKEKRSAELVIANKELAFQGEEKEKRAAELILANKELESFTYVSSHDLQEPLRKIRTLAGRILEKENQNLSDSGKNYFHMMQNAAERMQTLIQDLLAFSHLSMADRKFETADLNIITEEIKKEFTDAIAEKNAVIELKEICDVKVIPFQFRQLMHNLISNALKFSNPKIPPHIKISSVNQHFGN